MSVRLLADENFPFPVCRELRRLGHDVRHLKDLLSDPRAAGPDDQDVLESAIADRRTLITDDVNDFIRLHDITGNHCGIIVCAAFPDPRRKAKTIDTRLRDELREHGALDRRLLLIRRSDYHQ